MLNLSTILNQQTHRCCSLYTSRSWRFQRRWSGWCRNRWPFASIDPWVPYQTTGTVHDVTLLMLTALNIFGWIFMWKVKFAFCCILGRTWVVVVTIITNLWFNCCRCCDWFGIPCCIRKKYKCEFKLRYYLECLKSLLWRIRFRFLFWG